MRKGKTERNKGEIMSRNGKGDLSVLKKSETSNNESRFEDLTYTDTIAKRNEIDML